MELIVAGYVKVRNRRALMDLLTHRLKVLAVARRFRRQSGKRRQGDPGRISVDRSRPRRTQAIARLSA